MYLMAELTNFPYEIIHDLFYQLVQFTHSLVSSRTLRFLSISAIFLDMATGSTFKQLVIFMGHLSN